MIFAILLVQISMHRVAKEPVVGLKIADGRSACALSPNIISMVVSRRLLEQSDHLGSEFTYVCTYV